MTDSTDDVDWADLNYTERIRKEKKMGKVSMVNVKEKTAKLKVGNVEYKLPTQMSEPVDDIGGYTLLIYGRKKIGKTSFASMFPKALFLMFEPGGKALRIYQEPMTSWKKFTRFVELLKKDKTFRTVVIDTADFAYNDCLKEVCSGLGIKHPADAPYGAGWNAVKEEFTKQIRALLNSGKGVIFISHQKSEEYEDREGKTEERIASTLPKQGREVIEGLVDIWVNYDYAGTKRVLTILGRAEVDAGHRLKERFRYTDGTRIRRVHMGQDEKEGYDNFIMAFNNKIVKGGANDVPVEKPRESKVKKLIKVKK